MLGSQAPQIMVDSECQEPLYDALSFDVMSYAECCVDGRGSPVTDLTFEEDMFDCDDFVCWALVEESLGNVDWHDLPCLMELHDDCCLTFDLDDDEVYDCDSFQDNSFCHALVDDIDK